MVVQRDVPTTLHWNVGRGVNVAGADVYSHHPFHVIATVDAAKDAHGRAHGRAHDGLLELAFENDHKVQTLKGDLELVDDCCLIPTEIPEVDVELRRPMAMTMAPFYCTRPCVFYKKLLSVL